MIVSSLIGSTIHSIKPYFIDVSSLPILPVRNNQTTYDFHLLTLQTPITKERSAARTWLT